MSDLREEEALEEGEYTPTPDMLEIAERYANEETVRDLSKEFGIPRSTIYDNFKKMGITTGPARTPTKRAIAVVRKAEIEALAEEAEKIASIAIKLGGVIARRYGPLLDFMMSQGKSLELIAEEIMSWFEDKTTVQTALLKVESERDQLYNQLEKAWGIALPNFRYELRTRLLNRYAVEVLNARTLGVKIPVKRAIKAFYNDLLILEGDIEDIVVKSI